MSALNSMMLSLAVLLCQTLSFGFADESSSTTGESPLGRYLLVAGEGLYVVEPDGNCSWSYNPEKNQNRVQAFVINADRNITATIPATVFGAWKKSATEPRTGFVEHRLWLIQPLSNWTAPCFHRPECAGTRFMRKKPTKPDASAFRLIIQKHYVFLNMALSS